MHAAVNRFVVFENETFSLLNTELGPGHTGLEVGQPFHYRGSQPQMWMTNPPIPLRWWHRRRGGGRMEQWNKNKWTLINRCIIRSRVFGGQPSSWNSDKWSAVKNVGLLCYFYTEVNRFRRVSNIFKFQYSLKSKRWVRSASFMQTTS